MSGQEDKTVGTKAGETGRTSLLGRFASDTSGATAIEYALMGVLLGVPILATMTLLRTELVTLFSSVVDGLAQALSG